MTISLTPAEEDPDWGLVALTPPNNTTIDGGGLITFEVLHGLGILVRSGISVALKNLIIVSGPLEYPYPQGVINEGALTLNTIRLSNNFFPVVENYGTFTVRNGVFSNNGIGSPVDSAIVNYGSGVIDHSTFSSNVGPSGGAIDNRGGTLGVKNSIFSNNVAEVGGAIANEGTLTVNNCEFSHNASGFPGGAIYSVGQSLNVANSTFSGNVGGTHGGGAISVSGVTTVIIDSCGFLDNEAREHGGGAISSSSPLVVRGSTFLRNRAAENGGAIEAGNVDIRSGTFNGNEANYGGAIDTAGALTAIGSSITANTARIDGGGIYVSFGGISPTLLRTSVSGNIPNDVVVVQP